MKHFLTKTVLISLIPALVLFFAAVFSYVHQGHIIGARRHKDTVLLGSRFLEMCAPVNFLIEGNKLTSTGPDPKLYFEYDAIAPYRYVIINLSDLSGETVMQVFWAHEGEHLSEDKSSTASAALGANYLRIPDDGIVGLRFDLASAADTSMVVEQVTFSDVGQVMPGAVIISLLSLFVLLVSGNAAIVVLLRSCLKHKPPADMPTGADDWRVNRLTQAPVFIFAVLFLMLLFGIYIHKPLYLIFDNPEFTAPGVATDKPKWLLENALISMLSIGLLVLIRKLVRKDKRVLKDDANDINIIPVIVYAAFLVIIFISKLSLFTDNTSNDNAVVRQGMYGLMNNGTIPASIQDYLSTGANNRGIVLLYGGLGSIAKNLFIPYRPMWLFADSLFVTLALIFAHRLVMLFCGRRHGFIILTLLFGFLVFSACITPLANTPGDWYSLYTDTGAMAFFTMSAYFFVSYITSRGGGGGDNALILSGALTSSIGSLFNPAVFITVIAFAIIIAFQKTAGKGRLRRRRLRRLLLNYALLLIGLLVIIIPFEAVYSRFETIEKRSQGFMGRKLVMGMLNTHQNINDNGTMVFNDPPSLNPFIDRGRWNIGEAGFKTQDVIKARLKNMNVAMLGFYYLKDVYNLSFTFRFGGSEFSRNNTPESYYQAPFLRMMRAVFLKIHLPLRAIIWNVMYWLIGLFAYAALKKKITISPAEIYLCLTMLGAAGYLTLFESGDRYPMQFWPFFFVVSGLGLKLLQASPPKARSSAITNKGSVIN